ncbi:MAG: transposase [Firmicutes bacterium]|nr:transposase [Bacillota bacterium]
MSDNYLNKRKNVRLKGYNYASYGSYFVTICCHNKQCLFGRIPKEKDPGKRPQVILNDAGNMIGKWFKLIENKFKNIICDSYITMPNHIHFVIFNHNENPDTTHTSLENIVGWFKTMTTNEYISSVKNNNWPAFNKHLWQRSFFEHIIRNDEELFQIREYILNNPIKWSSDKLYVP